MDDTHGAQNSLPVEEAGTVEISQQQEQLEYGKARPHMDMFSSGEVIKVMPDTANWQTSSQVRFVINGGNVETFFSPKVTLYMDYTIVKPDNKDYTEDDLKNILAWPEGNMSHGIWKEVKLATNKDLAQTQYPYASASHIQMMLGAKKNGIEELVTESGLPLLNPDKFYTQKQMEHAAIDETGDLDSNPYQLDMRTLMKRPNHVYSMEPLHYANQTNRLLPPNMHMTLTLVRGAREHFFRKTHEAPTPSIRFNALYLYVQTLVPTPQMTDQIIATIAKMEKIQYPIKRTTYTTMQCNNMATTNHRYPTMIAGDIPSRVALGFVCNASTGDGSFAHPSYAYINPGIKKIRLKYAGKYYPNDEGYLFPTFAANVEKGNEAVVQDSMDVHTFRRMFKTFQDIDPTNKLSYDKTDFFSNTRTLFFFDMTASRSAAALQNVQENDRAGQVELEFELENAVPTQCNVVIYQEFKSNMGFQGVTMDPMYEWLI